MVLFVSKWYEYLYISISTGACIIFYQGGTIDNCTHVSDPVAHYIAESEYNAACTAEMDLAHFRMLNDEFLNKVPNVVP